MQYTHEETHKKVIEGYHNYLGDRSGVEEIEEVYAKAKAWDKYLESTVRQEAIDEFGEDDPRVDFAVELTKEIYMEDTNNE
ncbi:hypothetical protein KYJ98_02350 [Mammaliicoccus lentus]|uniref:hypothetical protein n=1 Tax=Mammaliicoccus lentus TaxID=42858 RepID=UPI001C4E27E9|nr:hypothetical protein [Mammaliicoccus lentus]MBW0769181.1 hypothetical protein [Mammaliicoccus lentus]